jgi:hypothetical protein
MQLRFTHAGAALSLLGGVLSFAACTSSSSRSASKDAGVDAAPKPCKDSTECDDADPCNGIETCDTNAGICKAGENPCANPDPAHCDTTCAFSGGLNCSLVARDGDGDGHGDASCQQAPGQDCDDADKTIFPGANELCDGVDSDCDGKVDVDDGLPLSGAEITIVEQASTDVQAPSITWASASKKFGVVWRNDTHIWFGLLDASGTLSAIKQVSQGTAGRGASITSDGQGFAVVYDTNDATQFLAARKYDASGNPLTPPVKIADVAGGDSRAELAKVTSGWLVAYHSLDFVFLRKLNDDLTPAGAAVALNPQASITQFVSLAAGNTEHGIAYLQGYHPHDGIFFARVNDAFSVVDGKAVDKQLPSAPTFDEAAIAWVGDGWSGAASGNGPGSDIVVFEAAESGSIRCGAKAITGPKAPYRLGNVALHGTMRLLPIVESAGASGVAKLYRLDDNCSAKPGLDLGTASMPNFDAFFDRPFGRAISVAVGDSKIAVVWHGAKDGFFQVKARIFGKNFCD